MRMLFIGETAPFDAAALFAGGAGGGGFSGEWYEARRYTDKAWQEAAGSTAAALDSPVGKIGDLSPNAKDVSQATSASRFILRNDGSGKKRFELDGVDDFLSHATPTGYAAGACSMFATVAGVPPIVTVVAGEGHTSGNYSLLRSSATVASSMMPYIRNDANVVLHNVIRATNAFLATPTVIGVVDTGSQLTGYVNGVVGSSGAYTRSGVMTLSGFMVGSRTPSGQSLFGGYIYNIFKIDRVLTDPEISQLVAYLGAQAGLSL